MSEMVERVAIAVCEADGCLWSEATDLDKGLYRDTARDAIAAMREPTEAMCDASHSAELAATDQPALSLYDLRRKAARKFTAMIDEALK